ncbi:MAG TPA: histidine kinase [Nocardioidaceae bacterium]|nr:histidine kinase [Nocardioidaceae bacterium]
MPSVRPAREAWVLALACGLWAAGFLATEPGVHPTAQGTVTLLVVLGVLGLHRFPIAAALLVAAAALAAWRFGVPSENPAGLAPGLVAIYSVARRSATRQSAFVVVAFVLVTMTTDEFSVATGLFGFVLFGGTWGFGLLVSRRSEAARAARQEADRLEAEDPAVVTAEVVAQERSLLTAETVSVIRSAVAQMQRVAADAENSLDPRLIRAIQDRGAAAVAELRRLLGLLRTDPIAERSGPETPVRQRRWRVDVLTAGAVAALGVADVLLIPDTEQSPLSIGLTMVFYAALAFRRTDPAVACLVATVPAILSIIVATPMTHGFAETLATALLAWSAATRGERWSWAALVALASAVLFGTWLEGPANVAIVATLFGLPAFAGHAWSEREREQRAAEQQSSELQRHRDREVARAVTAERLRIARDLHDVTSHAVGVMVLQAGAAEALRPRSSREARAALRTVQGAGTQALSELDALLGVLDVGGLGTTARTAGLGTESLEISLGALAERMRVTGVRVELALESIPTDSVIAATAFRVIQEALTNSARHAPGTQVRIRMTRGAGGLEVEVYDDGIAQPSQPSGTPAVMEGSGFGLVGLAERVRSLGGAISAGPGANGGFAVVARIPEPHPTNVGPDTKVV